MIAKPNLDITFRDWMIAEDMRQSILSDRVIAARGQEQKQQRFDNAAFGSTCKQNQTQQRVLNAALWPKEQ